MASDAGGEAQQAASPGVTGRAPLAEMQQQQANAYVNAPNIVFQPQPKTYSSTCIIKSRLLGDVPISQLEKANMIEFGEDCTIFILPIKSDDDKAAILELRQILKMEATCLDRRHARVWRVPIDAVSALSKVAQLGFVPVDCCINGMNNVHTWTMVCTDEDAAFNQQQQAGNRQQKQQQRQSTYSGENDEDYSEEDMGGGTDESDGEQNGKRRRRRLELLRKKKRARPVNGNTAMEQQQQEQDDSYGGVDDEDMGGQISDSGGGYSQQQLQSQQQVQGRRSLFANKPTGIKVGGGSATSSGVKKPQGFGGSAGKSAAPMSQAKKGEVAKENRRPPLFRRTIGEWRSLTRSQYNVQLAEKGQKEQLSAQSVTTADSSSATTAAVVNESDVVDVNVMNIIPDSAFIVQTQEEFDQGAAVTTPYVQAFPYKEHVVAHFPEGPRKQLEIIRTISTHNKPKLFVGGYCYRRERHGPPVTSWTCSKLGCWARISERNGELYMKAGSFGHTHGADMIDIELQLVLINQKRLALTTNLGAREIVQQTTRNLLEATAALIPGEQAQKQRVYDFRHAERERLAAQAAAGGGEIENVAAAGVLPVVLGGNVLNILDRNGRLLVSNNEVSHQPLPAAAVAVEQPQPHQQQSGVILLGHTDDDVAAVADAATTLTIELDEDDDVMNAVVREGGLLGSQDVVDGEDVLLSHHQV